MINVYVSPKGDDANPGTAAAPLRTPLAARDHVRGLRRDQVDDDVTVHLAAGVHRLNQTLVLEPEDGGVDTKTVTWCGAEGGGSIVSSGYPLSAWQPCSDELPDLPAALRGRVWVAELPAGTVVRTLYGPQGAVPRARGEAIKPHKVASDDGSLPVLYGPDGHIRHRHWVTKTGACWHHDRFGFPAGAIAPAADLAEAEFLVIPQMQWTMNVLPVKSVDFDAGVARLAESCTYPIGNPPCAPEGSIWLENSFSVMTPGTWVYHASSARLFYCPEGAEPEPEAGLEAACLTEFIRLEGGGEQAAVTGLHIRNLTFTRSNRFAFHGLTGRGIQHDWEMHDAASCMLRLRHARGCVVADCTFADGGSGGARMDLACRGNRIERCEFKNLGGCGVVLCGYGLGRQYANRDNAVVACHLHNLGQHYWHCPGIFIWQSGDNHIADNHLHDLPYTGIVCSGRSLYDREGVAECSALIDWDAVEEQCGAGYAHTVWHYGGLPSWWMREPLMHARDNLIEYNRIHDVMQVMGDGNGIYISGGGGGNVVRFNAVGPCPSPTMAEGIRCDDDQHHTILHGNLIFGQHGHATGITLKGVNRVTNNILALPLKRPDRGMLSLETGPLNGSVIKHNIIYTSAADQTFVGEIRIHGEGRKARLRDTDSDANVFYCSADLAVGQRWLDELQSFGVDLQSSCDDPGFIDAEAGDFRLRDNAPALALGFQALPLERMLAAKPSRVD
ncbi:MAG: right-handed parallel beta-helix repeat-containing protein [Planctomycetota bacterium]|jgi:hypothetical protein|nr:right-handed parallel beta-helix repeat-containing protein [Planctomycetota bacterium]